MPFCFYFKNYLLCPNLNVKTHIFYKPKICLFLKKYFFYFNLGRDPNEPLCKISASYIKMRYTVYFFELRKRPFILSLRISWRFTYSIDQLEILRNQHCCGSAFICMRIRIRDPKKCPYGSGS